MFHFANFISKIRELFGEMQGEMKVIFIFHCEEERRSNRTLYRVDMLPCGTLSLAMTISGLLQQKGPYSRPFSFSYFSTSASAGFVASALVRSISGFEMSV